MTPAMEHFLRRIRILPGQPASEEFAWSAEQDDAAAREYLDRQAVKAGEDYQRRKDAGWCR